MPRFGAFHTQLPACFRGSCVDPRPDIAIVQIGALSFCVAWATRGEMNSFFYVTEREAQFRDDTVIDWRATALEDLKNVFAEGPSSMNGGNSSI